MNSGFPSPLLTDPKALARKKICAERGGWVAVGQKKRGLSGCLPPAPCLRGSTPTSLLSQPGSGSSFREMGRGCPLGKVSASAERRLPPGKTQVWLQGPFSRSQSAAMSAPWTPAATEWAQSSGRVAGRGGACRGSEGGPSLLWSAEQGALPEMRRILHVAAQAGVGCLLLKSALLDAQRENRMKQLHTDRQVPGSDSHSHTRS